MPALIRRATKYRLYPNGQQRLMIAKTCGCSRKVWNLMLADKKEHYASTGEMLYITPAAYKPEHPYLKEADSFALCNAQLDLDKAYRAFFEGRCGFPKFKKKRCGISYTTNSVNGNIAISERGIKLPRLGVVRAVYDRDLNAAMNIDRAGTARIYACGHNDGRNRKPGYSVAE